MEGMDTMSEIEKKIHALVSHFVSIGYDAATAEDKAWRIAKSLYPELVAR